MQEIKKNWNKNGREKRREKKTEIFRNAESNSFAFHKSNQIADKLTRNFRDNLSFSSALGLHQM